MELRVKCGRTWPRRELLGAFKNLREVKALDRYTELA
jgi:hypothetical protein